MNRGHARAGPVVCALLFVAVLVAPPPVSAADSALLHLPAGTQAIPLAFGALAGWRDDDLDAWWLAFQRHCRRLADQTAALREGQPPPVALRRLCAEADRLGAEPGSEQLRAFLEERTQPLLIMPPSGHGFLTGYYEPGVEGALAPGAGFEAPVLAPPAGLIPRPRDQVPEGWPVDREAALERNGRFEPLPDRTAIEDGALGDSAPPLLWLRDRVEVFFLQVQGSGRVRLPDGRVVRLAYAGRNGHPYTSVAREIVRDGLAEPAVLTMGPLKAFLREDPARGLAYMRRNASYVFFRVLDGHDPALGPIGGAGLPLTPGRSLAVDRSIWSYGLPIWIDARLPDGQGGEQLFRRLMIAEDTGSAILGPARGDLFMGSGEAAGAQAGLIRHPGRFVVLWPREVSP